MGMKIGIAKPQETLGTRTDFRFETTAEALDAEPENAVLEGMIEVVGALEKTGDAFRVSGEVRVRRIFVCDRCLAEKSVREVYPFAEEFRRAGCGETDAEATVFEGDVIDLAPLVRDTILAAQPIRNLCRPDCMGLCPKCGADLNRGDCGCDREVLDIRLEALKEWMNRHDIQD